MPIDWRLYPPYGRAIDNNDSMETPVTMHAPNIPPDNVLAFQPILRNIAYVTQRHGAWLGEFALRMHVIYIAERVMEINALFPRDDDEALRELAYLSEFKAGRQRVADFMDYLDARGKEFEANRNG